jgi:hypothetical protein
MVQLNSEQGSIEELLEIVRQQEFTSASGQKFWVTFSRRDI